LPFCFKIPRKLLKRLIKCRQLLLVVLAHLLLSKVDFSRNDMIALPSDSEVFLGLLELGLDDLLVSLVQLIEFVAVVVCEHALDTHTHVAWGAEIFHCPAWVAHTVNHDHFVWLGRKVEGLARGKRATQRFWHRDVGLLLDVWKHA
jgi:hypothetical protein